MKKINKFLFLIISLVLLNINLNAQESLELQLFNAVENNNISEVKGLLESGVDIDTKNNVVSPWGFTSSGVVTPLMLASYMGYESVVRLLIEKGANVNAKDNDGCTALTWASRTGHVNNIVNILIEQGADLNTEDNNQCTPLIWAIRMNRLDIAKLLIERGADLNAKDNNGCTALMFATGSNKHSIAKLLIERGADVDAENNQGRTALHEISSYECEYSSLLDARILIEYGADVDAKDILGNTPLILATANGYESMVRLLIERGADVNVQNKNGDSVLIWAERAQNRQIAELLKAVIDVEKDISNFQDQSNVIQEILAIRWLNQCEFKKLALIDKDFFYKDIAKVYVDLKSGVLSYQEIAKILYGFHNLSTCLKSNDRLWSVKLIKFFQRLALGYNIKNEKEAYVKLRSKVKQIQLLTSKLSTDVASKIVLEY